MSAARPKTSAHEALQRILRRRERQAPSVLRREAAAGRRSPLAEDRIDAARALAAADAMEKGSAG